ncbi:MAG TPA: ABC transporter ATPase [Gammaproteobacteria bacterium]|nr:ABC transporter ATPase [Gammaproteobacteria bacterium]|tara:strand:+ start:82 stop:552 length:471 start_codon:yes stop_codon:yes gene_type:complete
MNAMIKTGLCLSLLMAMVPGVSAELYRYKNEYGVTVLDSHVPARYVKNGYTILSLDGRILEVVPRALTDGEIRERDRKLAEEERLERLRREQDIADENLMRLYSTPAGVVEGRDTKLSSINGFITTQQNNLTRLQSQKRQLQSELADIERAGRTIS